MMPTHSACELSELRKQSPKIQRAFVDEMCRRSLPAFFRAGFAMLKPGRPIPSEPYIDAMLHNLQQLVTGDMRRLVNNVPPRQGKTEFGTVMLTAWILGRDPTASVFVVSYGMQLSEKITGTIRKIIEHPDYKRIFPKTRLKVGHNRIGHFVTTDGGECMACSQESAITGFGTQYMFIDDFHKAHEAESPVERENAVAMVKDTLVSRFDNLADGRFLVNQQRLHPGDISGWAIELGWPKFVLPAVAVKDESFPLPNGGFWHRKKGDLLSPDRLPQSYLDDQKLMQGNRHYSAQYQQDPDVSDSCLINMDWFGEYDERPIRTDLIYVVQSWDPAISGSLTSDYSAGLTAGFDGENWYLLDVIRRQLEFPDLLRTVEAWHKKWRADVLLIEGVSIGQSLAQSLRAREICGVVRTPVPVGSKEERLASRTALLESGNFLLPKEAPWLEDWKKEILAFPDWRNDDQVDALTQFLGFVFGRSGQPFKIEITRQGRPRRVSKPRRRPHSYSDRP